MKTPLHVFKIGGNVIDSDEQLAEFLQRFHSFSGAKVLVHGGGKIASRMSKRLGIEPEMYNGRRITDRATLEVVTMVYAGWVNKNIVASLQALQVDALGITGADVGSILSEKRPPNPIDFGFVGDVKRVNARRLAQLLELGITPVLCAITHDGKGQLLNTNADTIAAEVAIALSDLFEVSLIFCFEKNGVLSDPDDGNTVIPTLSRFSYKKLLEEGVITAGMMPKLENCYRVLDAGVKQVYITHARHLPTQSADQFQGTAVTL